MKKQRINWLVVGTITVLKCIDVYWKAKKE